MKHKVIADIISFFITGILIAHIICPLHIILQNRGFILYGMFSLLPFLFFPFDEFFFQLLCAVFYMIQFFELLITVDALPDIIKTDQTVIHITDRHRNGIFHQFIGYVTESKTIKYAKTLNIAGNLDTGKCKYIKELNNLKKDIQVNLYGPNYDENVLNSESIHYKGKFPSDEIPYLLDEGFGLVWDGDGINGCSGNTGEYLRYNNPHKLSLYMVSGLPVVIWSKAAEAEFVINNKVGVVVNDINDFNDVFDKIDEKTYYEMVENTKKISEKMRNGKYLEQVVNDILTTL